MTVAEFLTELTEEEQKIFRHPELVEGSVPFKLRITYMSLWFPFQSREVKDIISHLTPEEHASLLAFGTRDATWYGRNIAGPMGIIGGPSCLTEQFDFIFSRWWLLGF